MFQTIKEMTHTTMWSMSKVILLFILAILLSSCLDISAAVTINEDSSIQMQLRYQYTAFMIQLSKTSDFASYLPVPASYDELLQKAGGFADIRISENNSDMDNVVQCQLDFPDIETFAAFFASRALELLPSTEEAKALQLVLHGPALVAGSMMSESNELQSYIDTVFAENNVAISFAGNGRTVSGTGFSSVDDILVYTSPVNSLVFAEEPVLLELSW